MKLIVLSMTLLIMTGCNKLDRITHGGDTFVDNADVTGIWTGSINVNGTDELVQLKLKNPTGTPLGTMQIGTIIYGGVIGNVRERGYIAELHEGNCPNKWAVNAHIEGSTMILAIDGQGNPGDCYGSAIHAVGTLSK